MGWGGAGSVNARKMYLHTTCIAIYVDKNIPNNYVKYYG